MTPTTHIEWKNVARAKLKGAQGSTLGITTGTCQACHEFTTGKVKELQHVGGHSRDKSLAGPTSWTEGIGRLVTPLMGQPVGYSDKASAGAARGETKSPRCEPRFVERCPSIGLTMPLG